MFYFDLDRRAVNYGQTKELKYSDDDFETIPEYYETWKKIWGKKVTQNYHEDTFLQSLIQVFRNDQILALLVTLLYNQIIVVLPIFAYYIFQNILNNTYKTSQNVALVVIVVVLKLSKPFLKLYAEERVRRVGQHMHTIVSRAVLDKVLKVSLLSNKEISSSELIKIMQVDIQKIQKYLEVKFYVISTLYNIIFSYASIVYLFGFAGLIGSLVMFLLIIIRFLMKKVLDKYQEEVNTETSNRVVQTVDIFNIIKFIKVAALQIPYLKKLITLREIELNCLYKKYRFQTIPLIAVMSTVRIVTLIIIILWMNQGKQYTPAVLFELSYIFLNINYTLLFVNFTTFKEINIALRSISIFLHTDEMNMMHITRKLDDSKTALMVKNGRFYWELGSQNDMIEQTRINLSGIDFHVEKGEFVSIIGKFGSGKSSLFNAILGEMKAEPGSEISINGSIAYVSQKPWIINNTVRNNILFGFPFDERKYNQIIHYCCLKPDLDILKDGDQTLIGERGCNLSGGQKARISLARALYSRADIYLLDDILSAVDAHVGSFIFFQTLSKYLQGKTILLVTHSLSFVKHTKRILIIDNCTLVDQGSFNELKNHLIFQQIQSADQRKKYEGLSTNYKFKSQTNTNYNQIILQNTQEQMVQFVKRCGGANFIAISIMGVLLGSIAGFVFGFWLNSWANSPNPGDKYYIYMYILLVIGITLLSVVMWAVIMHLPILMNIYQDMIKNLLFTSLNYFQVTPIAKIIHRLSNDLQKLDKVVLVEFYVFCGHFGLVFSFVLAIIYIFIKTENYILLGLFSLYIIGIVYKYQQYIRSIKAYRKIDDELKINLNNYFSEAVQGQTIIRAFNKLNFKANELVLVDIKYSSVNMIVNNIDSLIKFLLSFTSTLFLVIVLVGYFYARYFSQYEVFLLLNILTLEEYLQRINGNVIQFIIKLKSLAKCEELTNIEPQNGYNSLVHCENFNQEQKEQELRKYNQIQSGDILFRNISVRYKQGSQSVLKSLNFSVLGGQKIGIVGRTGSGKSTLFLAILRIIQSYEGQIFIDGINIKDLSLISLRKNINIILQDHFLFAGTVRDNIDPSHYYTDAQILTALKLCGLWDGLQKREGLETLVVEGGENLSVGERQLLNIARSLLDRKKIVLVDEATASIDIQTDKKIQEVFATHFKNCTMLTIAHRINTIANYDKILVLDGGNICEFDSLAVLLQKRDSLFRQLYEQSSRIEDKKS